MNQNYPQSHNKSNQKIPVSSIAKTQNFLDSKFYQTLTSIKKLFVKTHTHINGNNFNLYLFY